jgi:DNA-binding Lrp family transcriptional regulator
MVTFRLFSEDTTMVTAIVLINVSKGKNVEVAEQLVKLAGVSEVYSVAGRYDLTAIIRVSKNEDLADLITSDMLKIAGIQNTETLIAFRAYSNHDLEQMFEIGFD